MADEVSRRRRSPSSSPTTAKLDALMASMSSLAEAVKGQGELLREVREQVAVQHGTLQQIAQRQETHSKAIGLLQQGLGQVQGALATRGRSGNGDGKGGGNGDGKGGGNGIRWWEHWGKTMAIVVGVAGAIGTGLAALWQALKGGNGP